jgi:hypothetical protein
MYEAMEPLFACAMLPALVIALANDAFKDYHSLEEIFNIPAPRAGTTHILRIREEMLSVPFFQTFDINGPTGMIQKAMGFNNRTVDMGHRAGFGSNITTHCERREALVLADGTLIFMRVVRHFELLTAAQQMATLMHRESSSPGIDPISSCPAMHHRRALSMERQTRSARIHGQLSTTFSAACLFNGFLRWNSLSLLR